MGRKESNQTNKIKGKDKDESVSVKVHKITNITTESW